MMKKSILVLFLCSILFSYSIVETGFLRDNAGRPVNGLIAMRYRIYTVPAGGEHVWDSGNLSVTVNRGLYSVELGTPANPVDATVLNANNEYYLESVIDGETLTNRNKLYYVAKALTALTSITADIAITANKLADMNISQFLNDAGYVTEISGTIEHALTADVALIALTANAVEAGNIVGIISESQIDELIVRKSELFTATSDLKEEVAEMIETATIDLKIEVEGLIATATGDLKAEVLGEVKGYAKEKEEGELEVGTADVAMIALTANALVNNKRTYLFHIYGELEVTENIASKILVTNQATVEKITAYTNKGLSTVSLDIEKGNLSFDAPIVIANLSFDNQNQVDTEVITNPQISAGEFLRLNVTNYTNGADLSVIIEVTY